MKTRLTMLLALALLALPPGAGAAELAYDDGTFETTDWRGPADATAVRFDLPPGVPHLLQGAAFWFSAREPGPYTVDVHVWDKDLADVHSVSFTVAYDVERWYALDLSAAGLVLEDSFRIGFFQDDDAMDLWVGIDDNPPHDNSAIYFGGADQWVDNQQSNHGIRATVEPAPVVPSLACRGFGPPMHKPRTIRKGGRTFPLKATLADADGQPVGGADLGTAPVVQVLFYPESGGGPVDVSEFVMPPGRSNAGSSFRYLDFSGIWRYNLKTRPFAAAGSYEISMMSGDAEEYLVDPTCVAEFTVKAKDKPPRPQRRVRRAR